MEIVKSVIEGKFSDLGDFIKGAVISRINERVQSEKKDYINSLRGITEDNDGGSDVSIQFDNYTVAKKVAGKLSKFGAWAKEGDGCVYFKDAKSQKDAIEFLSDKYGFVANDPNGLKFEADMDADEEDVEDSEEDDTDEDEKSDKKDKKKDTEKEY